MSHWYCCESCSCRKWTICLCLFTETLPHNSQMTLLFCLCFSWMCWSRADVSTVLLQCGHCLCLCFAAMWSSSICCVSKLSTHFGALHLNAFILCVNLKWRFRRPNDKNCISHILHLKKSMVNGCEICAGIRISIERINYWNVPFLVLLFSGL